MSESRPDRLRVGLDARFVRDDHPGVGRYVHGLVRALAELDVDLVLLRQTPPAPSELSLDDLGPRVTELTVSRSPRSLLDGCFLPKVAATARVDVFHSPFPLGPFQLGSIPWGSWRGRPARVVTLHDLIPLRFPDNIRSPWRRPLFRNALRGALSSARLVICPSEATRQDLQTLWPGLVGSRPRPEVRVIAEAAAARFQPAETGKVEELKGRLGLRKPFVLWIGSRRRHKNVELLIQAWQRLEEPLRRTFQLVLAGRSGVDPESVRALGGTAVDDGEIVGLGPVDGDDLPVLYSGAELFVLPSRSEGFGLPVIEAMACGTAVACAAAGSLPEVAGDAARLFDPTSVDDLVSCLEDLLTSRETRDDMASRGLARAARLSWRSTAEKHLQAYRWAAS